MTNDGFLASNSTCVEGTCPLVAESSGWASDGGETSLIERGELCNTAASWALGLHKLAAAGQGGWHRADPHNTLSAAIPVRLERI